MNRKVYLQFLFLFVCVLSSFAQKTIREAYKDALLQFESKNYGQTQRILDYIFRVEPQFSEAYFLQGQLHEVHQEDRAAIESYQHFNQYNYDNPKAFIKITDIYRKHNYRNLARKIVEEGLKRYPDNPQILYVKAGYLYENGELDSAYNYLTKCIEKDHNFHQAYNDRGVILHCQGKDGLATPDFEIAILISPQQIYYLNQGVNLYVTGKPQNAILALNTAIRLDSLSAYAYNLRGVIYMEQGDEIRATADFLSAITVDAQYSYPYNNLANLLVWKKDYSKALSLYNTAIELDNQSPEIYFNRGNIKEIISTRLDDACQDWQIAVDLGMPRVVDYCQ